MPEDTSAASGGTTTGPSSVEKIVGALGLFVHCSLVGYLYLTSGLVVPWWGMLVLFVVWLGLFVQGIRWVSGPRPMLALAVPVLAIVFLAAVLALGSWVFGWSA